MYFSNCKTVGEAKTLYRTLAMQHHPDRGGDTATMQAINAEYHATLKRFDGVSYKGTDGKDHRYTYRQDVEQELMNKIAALFALKMDGVFIEIVGSWLWVYGETRPFKDTLKTLSFRWHSKRSKWYFHKKSLYQREYSGVDFEVLRAMYGSRTFEEKESSVSTV